MEKQNRNKRPEYWLPVVKGKSGKERAIPMMVDGRTMRSLVRDLPNVTRCQAVDKKGRKYQW